jgi:hypothetical protein
MIRIENKYNLFLNLILDLKIWLCSKAILALWTKPFLGARSWGSNLALYQSQFYIFIFYIKNKNKII